MVQHCTKSPINTFSQCYFSNWVKINRETPSKTSICTLMSPTSEIGIWTVKGHSSKINPERGVFVYVWGMLYISGSQPWMILFICPEVATIRKAVCFDFKQSKLLHIELSSCIHSISISLWFPQKYCSLKDACLPVDLNFSSLPCTWHCFAQSRHYAFNLLAEALLQLFMYLGRGKNLDPWEANASLQLHTSTWTNVAEAESRLIHHSSNFTFMLIP